MENIFFKPHKITLKQQTYIVGDIHGFFDKFQKNLNDNNITDSDLLIVNGDLINKGKQTIETFNYLMDRPNTIVLFGNHEISFINLMIFIEANGLHNKKRENITIYQQYKENMLAKWMDNHSFEELFEIRTKLFKKCYSSLEINIPKIKQKIGVVHAAVFGYDWKNINNVDFNVWDFSYFNSIPENEHKEIIGVDYVVFGHTAIRKAGMVNNSIYIDTGSYNRYKNDLTFFNVNRFLNL
jgi:predicted phosphodiesterase